MVRRRLSHRWHGGRSCKGVDEIAARHLATTERKIDSFRRLRRERHDALASFAGRRVAERRGRLLCRRLVEVAIIGPVGAAGRD